MTFEIKLEDGKYTFINDNGVVEILRYGEKWRNEAGDKALLSLLQKVESYQSALKEIVEESGCYDASCERWAVAKKALES